MSDKSNATATEWTRFRYRPDPERTVVLMVAPDRNWFDGPARDGVVLPTETVDYGDATDQHDGETSDNSSENVAAIRNHEFVLVLSGIAEIDARIADALYESGCDDATISVRRGLVYLSFAREAQTFQEAIQSAIRNVKDAMTKLGATVSLQ